jgi:nickel-dependent lactate racemase
MNHPSVAYIDKHSAPRVLFSGTRLIEVDFPEGTRVIQSNPPMAGLKNVDAAIRYALNHPSGTEPLYAKLRPGMKVFIAIDDISMPLPPMRRPDVRERILTIVLEMLADHGVDDFEMCIATAFHRRMTGDEIRHMVGDRIFDAYYPDRLYNHDAEDHDNMEYLGTTEEGEEVELNKKAVQSDLIIYVNLNLVPMNGGHKSVTVGLSGYRSLKAHHNPSTLRKCDSYMDPRPGRSALTESFKRMGQLVNKHLDVFHIESTINNRMFDDPLSFLSKNEDDYTKLEKLACKSLIYTLDKLPQKARQAVFMKVPAPFGVTGIFAGSTEGAHEPALQKCNEQYLVPVQGQADILVSGIPYISPYNVNAFLNPLLVQVMAQGYLFSLYRGKPLVKKGGTMIIFHPCSDQFDQEHHAPYIEFVHRLLPQTRDAMELHKRFEKEFASNPAYIEMYRRGNAYHPAHPFYMWYWGEPGRQHMGRVIVVGADNSYIPELLGYETAKNFQEALDMAKDTAPANPEITLFKVPPIMMADVS